MIKELKTACNKEFNNGSWKATDNFSNIINESNIYKIIKPTITLGSEADCVFII